jgi:hypothetical protein
VFSLAFVADGLPKESSTEVKRAKWNWRKDKKENQWLPKWGSVGRRKRHDVTYQRCEYEQTREACNDGSHQRTRSAVSSSFGSPREKVPNNECDYTTREYRQYQCVIEIDIVHTSFGQE